MTKLAKVLAAYQQKYDVDGRTLAKELQVQESGLTRMKQGRMPDAAALSRIIAWLVGK